MGKSFIIISPFVMTKGVRVWTTSIVADVSSASPLTSWFLLLWRFRFSRSSLASSAEEVGGPREVDGPPGIWNWRLGLLFRRLIADDGWAAGAFRRKNKALASGCCSSGVLRNTLRWMWESANRDHDWPAVRLLFSSVTSSELVFPSPLADESRPSSASGFSSGRAKYDKITERKACRWTCSDSAATSADGVKNDESVVVVVTVLLFRACSIRFTKLRIFPDSVVLFPPTANTTSTARTYQTPPRKSFSSNHFDFLIKEIKGNDRRSKIQTYVKSRTLTASLSLDIWTACWMECNWFCLCFK